LCIELLAKEAKLSFFFCGKTKMNDHGPHCVPLNNPLIFTHFICQSRINFQENPQQIQIKHFPFSFSPSSFLFFGFFSYLSQAGWREDVHADATCAESSAGEGHQMVRLPVAYAKMLGRGARRVLSS